MVSLFSVFSAAPWSVLDQWWTDAGTWERERVVLEGPEIWGASIQSARGLQERAGVNIKGQ